MVEFRYAPDDDLKVHEEGAVRLICRAFQSHENGLPEWIKNSADAYARDNAPERQRAIVVLFDYGRRGRQPSISCLDFCGITSATIERSFRIWADPEAATRGACQPDAGSVQGGHGNGGKCYMTQMFESHALIHTVRENKGCRYGVRAGSILFGYVPDRQSGRDFAVSSVTEGLERALRDVGCSVGSLPAEAAASLANAEGFTLVTGVKPKGYEERIPVRHLVEHLQEHPQMARTLQFCRVYVVVNGESFNNGRPLRLQDIEPIPGAETPRRVPIPSELRDPMSERMVSTTLGGTAAPGTLELHTSNVSMRRSRKGRHNVVFRARTGYIGFVPVMELDIQSPYRERIYGECTLESLEQFKQNDRSALAQGPLTRAVRAFIETEIDKYAREFEARDRKSYDQKEKDAVSRINEALDKWKNRFLSDFMRGKWGENGGGGESTALPTGRPSRIEVGLSHPRAGLGVSFRPSIRFFDRTGKRIRPVPFRWVSYDCNVALVDEDLMIINTYAYGSTVVHAETLDGSLKSNPCQLDVVRLLNIRITPQETTVPAGSRTKLDAICKLADGGETNDIYLLWTEDNPNVARVSSSGLVYGFAPGRTAVVAGDDKCMSDQPATVVVTEAAGKGPGDRRGAGYPRVLVSGVFDRDPDTQEHVNFSSDDPPVCQRPQDADRNIWWVNSASPLAVLYLDTSKGYGYETREWRMYMLERYVDVIVQVALTHGPDEMQSVSVNDWITKWGGLAAEIQAAVVEDLSAFIREGCLPAA